MSKMGMTLTVLCTGLVDAVNKDEAPEVGGFDLSAGLLGPNISQWLRDTAKVIDEGHPATPIDMVLHCPKCHAQHVDEPVMKHYMGGEDWANPPHRSHLCHDCGHIWRPADVPTNGVAQIKTRGKADSPVVKSSPKFPQTSETNQSS
jgi:hypothetical protein